MLAISFEGSNDWMQVFSAVLNEGIDISFSYGFGAVRLGWGSDFISSGG